DGSHRRAVRFVCGAQNHAAPLLSRCPQTDFIEILQNPFYDKGVLDASGLYKITEILYHVFMQAADSAAFDQKGGAALWPFSARPSGSSCFSSRSSSTSP